jgi:tellurite resistance protein TehA-like permease
MTEQSGSFGAGSPVDPAPADARPEPLPRHPISSWIATLDPGYFAVVMATGIVAIGARALGHPVLSGVLVWCTGIAFVVLLAAYLARAIRFPHRFAESLRRPASAVGYFTLVAGTNVLAICLSTRGMWLPALVLGAAAFLLWIALSYGLFCSIVLAGNRPVLREISGGWLIWVVGTQSVAVLATSIAAELPWIAARTSAGELGVVLWSVGVVLYLIFVVIIFLRLLLIETTPGEMGPAYWILMGATAISVRAGAEILELGGSDPTRFLGELRPFVTGLSVVLWSFGTWFIPLLVLFGIWRHAVRRHSWRYEPQLWAVVFPLGMYTDATFTLGREIHAGFMTALATGWIWVGLAAWLAVVVIMILGLIRRPSGPRAPRPGRTRPRRSDAP